MGNVYLNGNLLNGVTVNGTKVSRVFLNDTFIKKFVWGTVTVSFRWGYANFEAGTGCDNHYYWYPLNPQVYVSVTDATNVGQVTITTFDDDDFSSDCVTAVNETKTISLNTWTDIPVGSLTWTGDYKEDYCYINPDFKVRLLSKNNNALGDIPFWDTTYHMKYTDSTGSHRGEYYTLDTKTDTY